MWNEAAFFLSVQQFTCGLPGTALLQLCRSTITGGLCHFNFHCICFLIVMGFHLLFIVLDLGFAEVPNKPPFMKSMQRNPRGIPFGFKCIHVPKFFYVFIILTPLFNNSFDIKCFHLFWFGYLKRYFILHLCILVIVLRLLWISILIRDCHALVRERKGLTFGTPFFGHFHVSAQGTRCCPDTALRTLNQ